MLTKTYISSTVNSYMYTYADDLKNCIIVLLTLESVGEINSWRSAIGRPREPFKIY